MDWIVISTSLLAFAATTVAVVMALRIVRHATYITLADGRRQERSLPLFLRMGLPFCLLFPPRLFEGAVFADSRERLKKRIVSAGFEGLIKPREMMALRVLMPLVLGTLCCVLLYFAFPRMPARIGGALQNMQSLIYFLILVLFGFYPDSWLKYAVKRRHRQIERALPFVLDLLTLSVESGLDFMSGVKRIIDTREIDALGEELIRVMREIQVGRTRKEALQNFSTRINHADVRSVSSALIQADELGSGIAQALRVQSEQMRVRRFQRAEKLGGEAPVKLLLPLVVFIFPGVFCVLLGPVLYQMWIRGGF